MQNHPGLNRNSVGQIKVRLSLHRLKSSPWSGVECVCAAVEDRDQGYQARYPLEPMLGMFLLFFFLALVITIRGQRLRRVMLRPSYDQEHDASRNLPPVVGEPHSFDLENPPCPQSQTR